MTSNVTKFTCSTEMQYNMFPIENDRKFCNLYTYFTAIHKIIKIRYYRQVVISFSSTGGWEFCKNIYQNLSRSWWWNCTRWWILVLKHQIWMFLFHIQSQISQFPLQIHCEVWSRNVSHNLWRPRWWKFAISWVSESSKTRIIK